MEIRKKKKEKAINIFIDEEIHCRFIGYCKTKKTFVKAVVEELIVKYLEENGIKIEG